jgi:hypothetical protein
MEVQVSEVQGPRYFHSTRSTISTAANLTPYRDDLLFVCLDSQSHLAMTLPDIILDCSVRAVR